MNSVTVAAGIAALSISGVTVKDIDEIPESIAPRDCPILFPSPDGWMGAANSEPSDGPATFGTPTTRYWVFARTYNYVYLHAEVGSGRGLKDHYSGMCSKADAIIEAIAEMDISDVDVQTINIGEFGVLADPATNGYFGFRVTVTLRERINNV